MWIARLLSSIFWLIGGGFLYHLIKRLISNDAAILCTGFYLLTPFGIQASRSFQPDPLMVMGFIISISAIARYYDRKSSVRFFVAIAVGALAIFIKFVTLFPILGAFVFAGIYTEGFRRFISSRRCILFGLLSCLPAVVFYSYGLIVNKPFSAAASVHIMPHILIQPFFWKDWVETVLSVVTLPTMLGAVVGVLLLQDRFARGLLIGLWSGYFVFGVFFSYTISTHNYWSLQIIPIVALSLAPVIALIMNALGELYVTSYSRVAAAGILVLAGLIAASESRFILVTASNQSMTKIAREIGEIVRHSTQTVFLAHQYGKPLQYYGELSGAYWPRSIIDHRYARSGERQRSIQERLDSIGFKPEYFIITHFTEFNQHHLDLKEFLSQYCPVVAQNKDYVIYGACSL
jgi:hypothetical protein